MTLDISELKKPAFEILIGEEFILAHYVNQVIFII